MATSSDEARHHRTAWFEMICCILALLVAGPLGISLAPWEFRRDGAPIEAACCSRGHRPWRAAAVLVEILLIAGLFALLLHFLDPPIFRRLCTFPVSH